MEDQTPIQTEDPTAKYRTALRNIMTHISEHWGETFPGDVPGVDAIMREYAKLGWFDEESYELPGYLQDNPEVRQG